MTLPRPTAARGGALLLIAATAAVTLARPVPPRTNLPTPTGPADGAIVLTPPAKAGPMLAHMVFFTLKDSTPANRTALVEACREHLSGHEGVTYFSAGPRAEAMDRAVNDQTFDVALHVVFASVADHDRYQTHPRHLRFVEENKATWDTVRVFDSEVGR